MQHKIKPVTVKSHRLFYLTNENSSLYSLRKEDAYETILDYTSYQLDTAAIGVR